MRGTAMSTTSDPTSTGTRTTKTKASDSRERRAIEHLPCCADCAAMELRVVASGEGLAEHEPGPRAWPKDTVPATNTAELPCDARTVTWICEAASRGTIVFSHPTNRIKRLEPRKL